MCVEMGAGFLSVVVLVMWMQVVSCTAAAAAAQMRIYEMLTIQKCYTKITLLAVFFKI